MRPSQAKDLVAELQAAYPRSELPDPTVNLYVREIVGLEFIDARTAVRDLIRESRFLPTVAEILDHARIAKNARQAAERLARPSLPAEPVETIPGLERALEQLRASRERLTQRPWIALVDRQIAAAEEKLARLREESA